MCRLSGNGGKLFVTDGIQFLYASLLQQSHELVIPNRVERMQSSLILNKLLSGANHPLLTQFALTGG